MAGSAFDTFTLSAIPKFLTVFGRSVNYCPTFSTERTITAIFREESESAAIIEGEPITTVSPALHAQASDFVAVPAVQGDRVVIDSVGYEVADISKPVNGWLMLRLLKT